jgi:pimeloyl-ACP methyl ester carboxylesterase
MTALSPQSSIHLTLEQTSQTWIWQDYSIRYTCQGNGQPLVLIHGFGASIGHWRQNIPVLAAAGYRVYAIDLLGFGGSDKPALNYTMELWTELLQDFWATHIQAPTVWIGNSIGALLAQMMLAHHPETACAGVLINAAGGLNHRPEELNWPLRVVMGTFTKLVNMPRVGTFIFDRIRQKNRIRETLRQVYCKPDTITDELVELLYEPACHPGAQQVFASILTAPPGPSPRELLPLIQHPLLVLWGEADPWTPITGATIYQQHQQNGHPIQFTSIAQSGHCPHDEDPDQVNALILAFIREALCSTEVARASG